MSGLLAVVIGGLYAAGLYLMMRRHLVKFVIGLALLAHATNLVIFVTAGLVRGRTPIVPNDAIAPPAGAADPLAQALVLTAIVIGFATTALFLVVLLAARGLTGTDHVDGRERDR